MKYQAGFTLFEMLVALVISSVVMVLVAVNINSGNDSAKLESTSRELLSALRFVRSKALLKKQEFCLIINLNNNTYEINADKKLVYQMDNSIAVSLKVAENKSLKNNEASICFFEDGSSTGGTIQLEKNKITRTLVVNWITGNVLQSN